MEETQELSHEERQTQALESLRAMVLFWTVVGVLAGVTALLVVAVGA